MRLERFGFGFVLALGLLALPVWAEEEDKDQKIDLSKVPPAVKKAADKAVPGAKWERASIEKEKGKTIYELNGDDAKGRDVEVEITAEGQVIEIETEIPLSEVPDVVRDAFKAKYPKLKPSGAEAVTKEHHGKVFAYDIQVKEGKETEEYRVSADGKTIKEEEEEKEE